MGKLKLYSLFIGLCLAFDLAYANTYFNECINDQFGGTTIPFYGNFESNQFRPECAPEVLYTWTEDDLEKDPALAKDFLEGAGFRYTWRTPIATFGYGTNLLRIKLKKTTRFKLVRPEVRDCRTLSEEEKDQFVIVSPYYLADRDIYFTDYVICSSKVAHSWSMGTMASYLEAQNEYSYVKNNFTESDFFYDAYMWKARRKRIIYPKYIEYFIPSDVQDDWSWTKEALDFKLETIKNKQATVFYASDVERNFTLHIKIESEKTYFRLTDGQINDLINHPTP